MILPPIGFLVQFKNCRTVDKQVPHNLTFCKAQHARNLKKPVFSPRHTRQERKQKRWYREELQRVQRVI